MPYVLRVPTLITDFSSTTGMTLTQGTGSVALDTDATKRTVGSASLKVIQLASASSALVDLDCRNAAFVEADLRAAVNAIDDWVDTNASAFNTAIPQPARGALTTQQKAKPLWYVMQRRFEAS